MPLLSTGAVSGGATSGTGPGPAAPIAHQVAARAEASGAQAPARPSSSTSRRFGSGGRPPEPGAPSTSGQGPSTLGLSMEGPWAASALRAASFFEVAASAEAGAAREGARNVGSSAVLTPRQDPHARPLASPDAGITPRALGAAGLRSSDVARAAAPPRSRRPSKRAVRLAKTPRQPPRRSPPPPCLPPVMRFHPAGRAACCLNR
ncbi:hypothetical protein L914_20057 [Phytophthora nicotianae]|uniref:Uncharacterized protein n=1 Tax=Phytophthora nicotianae TaxID=4792 RepID=W2MAJ3_PHYNI|nr:hypothetical protein L914_20057 [Phytophthora nicotianae]